MNHGLMSPDTAVLIDACYLNPLNQLMFYAVLFSFGQAFRVELRTREEKKLTRNVNQSIIARHFITH